MPVSQTLSQNSTDGSIRRVSVPRGSSWTLDTATGLQRCIWPKCDFVGRARESIAAEANLSEHSSSVVQSQAQQFTPASRFSSPSLYPSETLASHSTGIQLTTGFMDSPTNSLLSIPESSIPPQSLNDLHLGPTPWTPVTRSNDHSSPRVVSNSNDQLLFLSQFVPCPNGSNIPDLIPPPLPLSQFPSSEREL
ncbi:hypothetical protein JCM5350_001596 [Sporobolomyces pararoseus]